MKSGVHVWLCMCVQIAKETNVYESALFCGSVRRISSMAAMVDWAEGIGS